MIEKKNIFHYSITAINTLIAVFALYFAFSHNKQLTDVDFLWETYAAANIPAELTKEQASSDNSENIQYFLSVWFNLKIVNTGFRAFTVDDIFVLVSPLETTPCLDKSKVLYLFPRKLTKPQGNGMPTNEKIELPIVIEPGHSKNFLKSVQMPISRNIYFAYKQKFKNVKSETSSFDENVCSVFQNYDIVSKVTLAGGQTKSAKVRFCRGDVALKELRFDAGKCGFILPIFTE